MSEERDELALEFTGEIADNLVARSEESNLYPAGYYDCMLTGKPSIYKSDRESFTVKSGDRAGTEVTNKMFGVPVGNFKFASYAFKADKKADWTDTSEKPATRMVKATFVDVDQNFSDRLSRESENGGKMVKAAKKGGLNGSKQIADVVEWYLNNRVIVHYGQTKGNPEKGYAKENFIISIEPKPLEA